MISGWGLLVASLAYVCGLFVIAWWGDRRRLYPDHARLRPLIYSLALAVYCSSWTFYGAVGSAVRDGLSYLPIYLGPMLLFLFLLPFFERLVRLAKQQNATSISDLLAARFGRSPQIAVAVTLIALTAAIPYIALQLKAISMSIEVLTAGQPAVSVAWYRDSALFIALMLALFSSLFGARQVDATEHHPGMVLAVAAESVVKFVALLFVSVFALTQLNGIEPLLETVRRMPAGVEHSISFVTQVLLSMTAIFCLPRQFLIGVVECAEVEDIRRARWWFSTYLALICLVVVPIAAAAIAAGAATGSVSPDSFVLWLPLSAGHDWLALLAYLGGFSAATGMVIVATVALATMVSNDLVLPALWRWRPPALGDRSPAAGGILWIRRGAILAILLVAFSFFRAVPNSSSLASIGLLAFAAVAQFAPAVVSAVYWSGASRVGVLAGLCSGFLIWIYTLLLPTFASADGGSPSWLVEGPFDIGLLAPYSLLGFSGPDPLTHGVFWSLLVNIATLVGMSLYSPPAIGERLQVAPRIAGTDARRAKLLPGSATVADLQLLADRLLGPAAAQSWFKQYVQEQGRDYLPTQRADVGLLQGLERELAGALGAASARMVLTSALRGAGLQFSEVVTLFDEASQKLRFNREMLEAMMENMPQGVSVVDADMRLVAWNRRYVELLDYPPELMRAGQPIADLMRYNAARGWYGPGDAEVYVERRLAHLRAGSPHLSERRRSDGRVIEVRGQPLPDGGYVSTFNDVTTYKHVEDELREINETLELRVAERTQQLADATAVAEKANLGKTRFLAAASHDLLQPLNAARLFNAALRGQAGQLQNPQVEQLADRVENSLHAAEELLDGLLDISRLDSGAIQPEPTNFSAGVLLDSLKEQFAPVAAQRNLELRVHATRAQVFTDQRMLRRVLQNLIGNALRYTRSGRVVVGVRRRAGEQIEFQVLDTGPGIAAESQAVIFEEFRRLEQQSPWGERGLGLGLSICDRIVHILQTRLTLRSVPGKGSAFSVRVARGSGVASPQVATPAPASNLAGLRGLRVLCVEDDPNILDAMRELLTRWGIEVVCVASAASAREVLQQQSIDLVLADYHLDGEPRGLELLDELVPRDSARLRAGALVTADGSAELAQRANELGFEVLRKPLRPAALRALLVALARPKPEERAS
ncbi:PAS domain-containing hybrid sensor histidine kinase/response regulator [Steroidobacter sp.]|uniref:hybrid sensor histidine kinase/response regulator n=1 Tax=Steroidobacter sp. TaxID=1978227 RepID=UPI001A4E80C4|nr:PAS domain-containing hybrid sensor histidine kinase/response regulator [Steroidobacter sp.]MBL8270553.1 PAS-domain containing protein [Steroidobacter sp.]